MKKIFLRLLPFSIILSIFISACSYPQEPIPSTGSGSIMISVTTTPTALNANPLPKASVVPSLTDDVWNRIVANKKIVVGTSWDYPPFASVDSNFKVVGYDIALIQEIGSRLKIPVEIQDYSFEGLQSALQINQIDLAVAAISITPERASQMTFSPVYYVNQTAILAAADSPIPNLDNVNQMKAYRIGVQRGTTYQTWVQRSMVDAGLMPASQLLSYTKAEDAVRDLEANRVDLVVLGQATASYYNNLKGLRMVGKGNDQQDLAVAMRLGTPRLKAEIDRVMGDMLTDGTVLRLIQKYIETNISATDPSNNSPQQTGTVVPAVSTATPAACVDGMKFVSDVTYGDNNMQKLPLLKPGEAFNKVWRVLNSGTCTWTPSYYLVYSYGNDDAALMSGQKVVIPANVAPGSEVEIGAALVAPTTTGSYQGFWQMENADAKRFGQTIWVGITTDVNQSTLTPQATATFCEVSLTGPNKSLNINEDFDAVWTVKNTSGQDWDVKSVDYKYISGTAMQKKNTYDLPQTIKKGESGSIIVNMTAPGQAGSYSSQWAIVSGSSSLCNLLVTVKVN